MLKIYNTATRKKEEFKPINPGNVKIYNCGLTVYDYPHIGNHRAYTFADTIRRGLEYLGYEVTQVQNFTDVGHLTYTEEQKQKLIGKTDIMDADAGIDRMEKAAQKTGMTVWEVAQFYINEAMKSFVEMNYLEPAKRPRATEYIQDQIELVQILLEKGFAYKTDSAIYFDTSKLKDYGKLTGQKLEDKLVAAREEVEIDSNKRNPADFRLWQLDQKDHVMQWDSPFGRGFPGWHLECSAMIKNILGNPIDIHTGGVDHIPVHHTNEIAQSESAFGYPFVNYWMHNEFLSVEGRRMGKSLGNAYTLQDIQEKGFEALDLRYFYLTANFRTNQNFTWEALEAARNARKKLIGLVKEFKSHIEESAIDDAKVAKYKEEFKTKIEDSFNTPEAIAVMWQAINDSAITTHEKLHLVTEFDKFLGLKLSEVSAHEEISEEIKAKLEEIITKRNEAKTNRDFSTSDKLRDEAKALGFELLDTKDGTVYKSVN